MEVFKMTFKKSTSTFALITAETECYGAGFSGKSFRNVGIVEHLCWSVWQQDSRNIGHSLKLFLLFFASLVSLSLSLSAQGVIHLCKDTDAHTHAQHLTDTKGRHRVPKTKSDMHVCTDIQDVFQSPGSVSEVDFTGYSAMLSEKMWGSS